MLIWARNSAAYRLTRAMLTEKQLRTAITRKAKQKFDGIDEEQVTALAEAAVQFAYDNKALDDRQYAEVRTRSEMRSGRSSRAIAQKLSLKGVDRETAAEALTQADDLFAAVAHARKRAFGPFRRNEPAEDRLAKEMASFARGGFGYDIARRVVAMPRDEADEILFAGPDAER